MSLFLTGLGCLVLHAKLGTPNAEEPAMDMMVQIMQPLQMRAQKAEARAVGAAAASMRAQSLSSHAAAGKSWAYASAMNWAMRDGAEAGCRGRSVCTRAVGLIFGTQTGKTEEAAGLIAKETGLEATMVDDVSPGDLAG